MESGHCPGQYLSTFYLFPVLKREYLHIVFLYVVGLCTLYGSSLYVSQFFQLNYHEKIQAHQLSRPAAISTDFEATLTRTLSSRNHWTLRGLAGLKSKVLHSPLTRNVVEGREDWLFLREESGRPVIDQSLGIFQYSPGALKAWSLLLQQRQFWTNAQGMDYLLVIVPNKSTIYPENLPKQYPQPAAYRSLDQLQASLPNLPVIDLTDSIRLHKTRGPLYYRKDTHWNDRGAYFAYQALMRALPPPYRSVPLRLTDRKIKRDTLQQGDLARMILDVRQGMEPVRQYEPRQPTAQFVPERSQIVAPNTRPIFYTQSDTTLPKVFFDHDSFFKDLAPFFAEHFSETTTLWSWQGFHTELIHQAKPDLVVDEFVERSLTGTVPRNAWPAVQDYWQQHFDRLPLLVTLTGLTFPELIPRLEQLEIPEGVLPILRIQAQPEQTDKLVIDYGDELGFYWLRDTGDTYYLEYQPGRTKSFRVENNTPCRLQVEVRGY